ncbi:LysR family transcriptional regulator [Leekyejoonella antrihumi]|uniref:LysR family transcriptional regulator n=1 Tax=Leekyejoonella antrihumi TaxID=1660198 RepID=A0A563E9G2_9MICO|nr:LysR family transcriptional regulator [Leekyejoonella antrihumi]TWP38882.1 LysR family transcriptional regulator [Leekyejoonella antrihumi]
MLDTRLLRTFHQVVESGSFSAAARTLGYTQPAISQQIRTLEKAVGTPLFIRTGRKMVLTEAGELLLRHAVGILADLSAAQSQVAAIRHLAAGRVRVCTFPSASATIVAAAAAGLRKSNPGIRVQLSEAEPPESLAMLEAGECDIALAFNYEGMPEPGRTEFVVRALLDDDMQVVLPVGHPLSRRRSVDLPELVNESWIAGCPQCRATFVNACSQAGFEPDIAVTTDDNLAVQSLVVAGIGVGVMPGLVLSFLRHPQIVARPLRPAVRRKVSAYTLADYTRIPATSVMLEALTEASGRLQRGAVGDSSIS